MSHKRGRDSSDAAEVIRATPRRTKRISRLESLIEDATAEDATAASMQRETGVADRLEPKLTTKSRSKARREIHTEPPIAPANVTKPTVNKRKHIEEWKGSRAEALMNISVWCWSNMVGLRFNMSDARLRKDQKQHRFEAVLEEHGCRFRAVKDGAFGVIEWIDKSILRDTQSVAEAFLPKLKTVAHDNMQGIILRDDTNSDPITNTLLLFRRHPSEESSQGYEFLQDAAVYDNLISAERGRLTD